MGSSTGSACNARQDLIVMPNQSAQGSGSAQFAVHREGTQPFLQVYLTDT
jgi:hypothetical protein